MDHRHIIVMGASAGGIEAIKQVVEGLPRDLEASIFIVWHMAPDVRGILPDVLNTLQVLPAANAIDGEPVIPGRIYVAPPDHHLMLEKDVVRISRGPRENRFRPAVDPLFRSAAFAYGASVIGVILSGALDDGAAGSWTIKQCGGLAVIQDPQDAQVPSMPQKAAEAIKADHIIPASQMGRLLGQLVKEVVPSQTQDHNKAAVSEINIAMQKQTFFSDTSDLTPYTCPECHGVLSALKEGDRIRFRCHTGHAFSADTLLASISENIEHALWNAIRNIRESVLFLNHMGDHFADANQPKLAAVYFKKANEAELRAQVLLQTVHTHEYISTDTIREEALQTGGDNADN
ncbi:MAG TPA: chemotaxis protein CheB [Chitinophaga sp.]|uniref:chemotaxis protein CheB n=1 Tax=Chitinophaga sp. TaxID=1869181 RepID=UPI002F91DDAE